MSFSSPILILTIFSAIYGISEAETSKYVAMGNLQTIINGAKMFSTDIDPDREMTPLLWCQLRLNQEILPITFSRFLRIKDRKEFVADLGENQKRALLHFGKSTDEAAGKYRCEIRAPDGTTIMGNMFAYAHPTIKNNDSWPLQKSENEEGLVEGPIVHASYETPGFIECPVLGYPEPHVIWYKDNVQLEYDERIVYNYKTHSLTINNAQDSDSGVYRCVATNTFPIKTDGPYQEFSIKLEQELRVGDNYGWMLPLAVIIITLLLLFLVIFTCQRCTQYKADQYNVAERERTLHNDQVPLKNNV